MNRIIIIIFLLLVLFACGCSIEKTTKDQITNEQSSKEEIKKLTMDIVIELAKKRDELSWGDFKYYRGNDVGSGLYVYKYQIDNKYSLLVGGSSLEEKPMYIYLINNNNEDKENQIDIRYDNIEEYLNGD